jgi:hypothetical protein
MSVPSPVDAFVNGQVWGVMGPQSNVCPTTVPVKSYNVRIAGSNPTISARSPRVVVSLGNVDSSLSGCSGCPGMGGGGMGGGGTGPPVAMAITNGSRGVIAIGESPNGDGGGVVQAIGNTLSLGARTSNGRSPHAIFVNPCSVDLLRPRLNVSGNMEVLGDSTFSGTLCASKYLDLEGTHESTDPFTPVSAAALRMTYLSLSNLVVDTIRDNLMSFRPVPPPPHPSGCPRSNGVVPFAFPYVGDGEGEPWSVVPVDGRDVTLSAAPSGGTVEVVGPNYTSEPLGSYFVQSPNLSPSQCTYSWTFDGNAGRMGGHGLSHDDVVLLTGIDDTPRRFDITATDAFYWSGSTHTLFSFIKNP